MSELFIDTSIAIARVVHGPEMKKRIQARILKHDSSVISLVVRQEFKRRLLREAYYLLRQLNEKRSYIKVLRHVTDVLGSWQDRKRNICLETLALMQENASGKPVSDAELTERAIRTLRSLLRSGLNDLRNSVSFEVVTSECHCSQYPVVEKVKYKKYEFGPTECSKTGTSCGVERLLAAREHELKAILAYLRTLPKKTDELQKAESFIDETLTDFSRAPIHNPCLEVGDLIIALESIGVQTFYTLNRKESLHFSRVLNQDLVIRPKNPVHDDEVLSHTASNEWPTS